MDELIITITGEEWEDVASLLNFVKHEEVEWQGMVSLSARDGNRTWWATDGASMAHQVGGTDDRDYDILVSPRSIQVAHEAAYRSGSADLCVTYADDTPATVTVRTPGVSLEVSADRARPFDFAAEFHSEATAIGTSVTLDARDLAEIVTAASRRPSMAADGPNPPFVLWLNERGLSIGVLWPGLGLTEYTASAPGGASGAQSRKVEIEMPSLVRAAQNMRGDITVVVPDLLGNAVRVHGEGRDVLIWPPDWFRAVRRSTEDVFAQVFGTDASRCDDDGDYPLSIAGTPIFGRLVLDEPTRIQVFAVVVDEIESSPELLAELNDYNARVGFARCFWIQNQVLAECDLVAGTTEPEELKVAYRRVRVIADDFAPMLAAMFGGELQSDVTSQRRWSHYLETVVVAEDGPNDWNEVSGASPWVFGDDTVWALTAFNPYGRSRPSSVNESENARLAARLIEVGAGIRRAVGRSADSDYAEQGFLVWGIDRETARWIGREFDQEAVFEIDALEVRVVSCFDDRIETRIRVSG